MPEKKTLTRNKSAQKGLVRNTPARKELTQKMRNVVFCIMTVCVICAGCGGAQTNSDGENSGASDIKSDIYSADSTATDAVPASEAKRTVAVSAGGASVFLDEARYYFYNTQATYEAYYIASGKTLDWSSETSGGVPLAEAVKSTVLDRICEREAIISFADEYGVTFTEKDLLKAEKKTNRFFAKSSPELVNRIDIERGRLKEVFQKDTLYNKVKKAINKKKKNRSEKAYRRWKKENDVITRDCFNALNFEIPIIDGTPVTEETSVIYETSIADVTPITE